MQNVDMFGFAGFRSKSILIWPRMQCAATRMHCSMVESRLEQVSQTFKIVTILKLASCLEVKLLLSVQIHPWPTRPKKP